MNALVRFSPELREWIAYNLARGCAHAGLITSMCAQGFQEPVARGLVDAFAQALARGEALPAESVVLDLADATSHGYTPGPWRLPAGNRVHAADREVDVLMRLQKPRVALLGNVLDSEECASVIALGTPRLAPSTVVDPVSGIDRVAGHRSSEGMFFGLCETPFIARIDARLSALMGMPLEHGEGLQLLRYQPGCHSSPHFDFLVPQNERNRASIARSGQRISTLVVYLNDVQGGGATDFPELGLGVTPHRGNAVYFEYTDASGQLDHATLHAGAAVDDGEKWVLTKWMRERPFVSAAA